MLYCVQKACKGAYNPMERSPLPLAIVNSKAIYDSDIDEMIA